MCEILPRTLASKAEFLENMGEFNISLRDGPCPGFAEAHLAGKFAVL